MILVSAANSCCCVCCMLVVGVDRINLFSYDLFGRTPRIRRLLAAAWRRSECQGQGQSYHLRAESDDSLGVLLSVSLSLLCASLLKTFNSGW
jgi:hypothetical protein